MTTTYTVRLPDGTAYGPAGMDLLVRWASEGRLSPEAVVVPSDGSPERAAADVERLRAYVLAPPVVRGVVPEAADDGVSALIPFRNGPALAGYYVGVFSLIPFVGLVLAPIAIGLGVAGLRKRKKNPRVKGGAHAWTAVGLGIGSIAITGGLIAFLARGL